MEVGLRRATFSGRDWYRDGVREIVRDQEGPLHSSGLQEGVKAQLDSGDSVMKDHLHMDNGSFHAVLFNAETVGYVLVHTYDTCRLYLMVRSLQYIMRAVDEF